MYYNVTHQTLYNLNMISKLKEMILLCFLQCHLLWRKK